MIDIARGSGAEPGAAGRPETAVQDPITPPNGPHSENVTQSTSTPALTSAPTPAAPRPRPSTPSALRTTLHSRFPLLFARHPKPSPLVAGWRMIEVNARFAVLVEASELAHSDPPPGNLATTCALPLPRKPVGAWQQQRIKSLKQLRPRSTGTLGDSCTCSGHVLSHTFPACRVDAESCHRPSHSHPPNKLAGRSGGPR
ncbi:hypothetical protein STPH1_2921 [Streptomyces sp. OM5714]|nr:hypothetical protein STPH1_2921 [Streptomyces sp. OM5714]